MLDRGEIERLREGLIDERRAEHYTAELGCETAIALCDLAMKELARQGPVVPAELWADILEFIEDHVDVVDGSDGPRPNRAMYLQQQIEAEVGAPDRTIDPL